MRRPDRRPVGDAFDIVPHPVAIDQPAAGGLGHGEHPAVDMGRDAGEHVPGRLAEALRPVAADELVIAADAAGGDDHGLRLDREAAGRRPRARLPALDRALLQHLAFDAIDAWPPDLRAVSRPWLTHQSGAKTPSGTAGATVDLVDTVFDGREIVVAGQVALDGEITVGDQPVRGVVGVPIVLGPEGWTRVLLDPLAPDEERRLSRTIERIEASLAQWGLGS